MPTLTVFTPAYNRAHTLWRTYESLCRQTSRDFEWLIVDDGSSDGTDTLVAGWIKEADFTIRYIYQSNQGMHGAHNTAYRNITTELNTCIDSDDWMPDDAVERIIDFWRKNGSDEYAGIIGLDIKEDGTVIGKGFKSGLKTTTLQDYYRNGGQGDKKLVLRTDVVHKYPEYPIFENERYVNLAYKYMFIDNDYQLLVLDEPLAIIDYQQDGSSMNMLRQYWRNPKGFAYTRKVEMIYYARSFKEMMRSNIHYVSHSIRAKNLSFIKESPKKWHTLLAIIPGALLFVYTWNKNRKK